MSMIHQGRSLAQALASAARAAAAVVAIAIASTAALADTIYLKDGRVLEGQVQKETEQAVWFVTSIGSIEHTHLFAMSEVERIERDASEPKAEEAEASESEELFIPEGACKITFITLEETVGPYLNADALKHSAELLEDLPEEQRPGIIVLQINSGGGALAEVEPLMEVIHDDLKKDYRVVGWIESAISAASLTIFNCEEIYMMREGNVGGTVAYVQTGPGQTKAAEGEDLERILDLGRRISENGRRNPLIMEAMQHWMTLSCDIDENGNITWYRGDQGEYLVSPEDRILTLNSIDAEKYGVSLGTADTKDELARLLGCTEWVEVGHEADAYQQEFRENVRTAQARAGELWQKIQIAIEGAGNSNTRDQYNSFIGRARRYLREMKSLVRRAPSLEKYGAGGLPPLNDDFFDEVDRQLRDMIAPRG